MKSGYEILQAICTEMNTDFQADTAGAYGDIKFFAGYDVEISNELKLLSKRGIKSYPLFGVVMPETHADNLGKDEREITIKKIIIATSTAKDMRVGKRIEKNFVPILEPILELFKEKFAENTDIVSGGYDTMITSTWVPLYSEDNQQSDEYDNRLDGIKIENFKFKIKNTGNDC